MIIQQICIDYDNYMLSSLVEKCLSYQLINQLCTYDTLYRYMNMLMDVQSFISYILLNEICD